MESKRRIIQLGLLVVLVGLFVYAFLSMQGKAEAVKVGGPAAEFKLEDTEGKQVSLSDYKGQMLVVNFFTTWCAPCKEEAPDLQKFEIQQKDKAKLLIIDREEPKERVKKFMEENKTTSTYLLDTKNKLAKVYNVVGQPETFIIDRKGIIQEHIKGPVSYEDLVTLVKKYDK